MTGFALRVAGLTFVLSGMGSPVQARETWQEDAPRVERLRNAPEVFWYDYGDPRRARETGSSNITNWMRPINGKEYGLADYVDMASGLAEEADLGMTGRIVSWDYPGGIRDEYVQFLGRVIKETGSSQRVILLFEGEGYGNPSDDVLDKRMSYLSENYFNQSWYARGTLHRTDNMKWHKKGNKGLPIVQIYNSVEDYNSDYTDKYARQGEKHGILFQLKNYTGYSIHYPPYFSLNPNFNKVQWIDYQPVWPRIETEHANIVANGFYKEADPRYTPKNYSLFRRNVRYSLHSGRPYLFIISRSEVWEHTDLDEVERQILKEETAAVGIVQKSMLRPPFSFKEASRKQKVDNIISIFSHGKQEKPKTPEVVKQNVILIKRDEEEMESADTPKAA
ncbi:MAG: hypothetical protein HY426_03940 [Candidatus Levybacteria bacterium]|nr:hypothetical protein [Candidatus Levybacteria bacterium]